MNDIELEKAIRLAVNGDEQAITEILVQYMPLINRCSVINGEFNEDNKQYIMEKMTIAILNFKI